MMISKIVLVLVLTVITRTSCSTHHKLPHYEITKQRLQEIRSELLYWFFDEGGSDGHGDYQIDIKQSAPQLQKDLNFNLPFYEFTYNYTRVSLNGYLEFTDGPETYKKYPLVFPRNYPTQKDPSFIGPFFSKMTFGIIREEDEDQRRPGVYYRVEENLPGRVDQLGVELRERLTRDIREGGVIGAQNFTPKHAIITTWKSLSFQGGIASAKYLTNTFQLVLATDESTTYAIFNYANNIQWTTHTEAGGDSKWGDGGVPAYIGFNAGYGTRAFEYHPYSQRSSVRDLTWSGCANGFRGRHVFRIDGKIMPGTCSNDMDYVCRLYLDEKNQGTKNSWITRN